MKLGLFLVVLLISQVRAEGSDTKYWPVASDPQNNVTRVNLDSDFCLDLRVISSVFFAAQLLRNGRVIANCSATVGCHMSDLTWNKHHYRLEVFNLINDSFIFEYYDTYPCDVEAIYYLLIPCLALIFLLTLIVGCVLCRERYGWPNCSRFSSCSGCNYCELGIFCRSKSESVQDRSVLPKTRSKKIKKDSYELMDDKDSLNPSRESV